MELLGPSLFDLLNFCNYKFSMKTVILIGQKMIKLIQKMHENNLIYGDIKPENIRTGLNEKSK